MPSPLFPPAKRSHASDAQPGLHHMANSTVCRTDRRRHSFAHVQLSRIACRLGNCLSDHDVFYSSCLGVQAGVAFYFVTRSAKPLLLKFTKLGNLVGILMSVVASEIGPPMIGEIGQIVNARLYRDRLVPKAELSNAIADSGCAEVFYSHWW
jgi:hypothetical protein